MSKKEEARVNQITEMLIDVPVEITFTEGLLGTLSGNRELTEEFIAGKHPEGVQQEEMEAFDNGIAAAIVDVDEKVLEKSTIFPRTADGVPLLWDYQWRGLLKEKWGAIRDLKSDWKKDLTAHKKKVAMFAFVKERQIPITLPAGTDITWCERPLRAQTAQGERVSLARAEEIAAGATCRVTFQVLKKDLVPYVHLALDYGILNGMLQWRNSGKGRFEWKAIKP